MDVNIQKYQAFLKAVEYGSFTKAAEALSYSQSGISRMIGDLEQEWNIILLERGRGGVRLTSDGLRLLPYAQNVCAEYKKLQMQVDELHGLQSGLIRIGTFSSVATHWLPNIIQQFQKDFPNIDFELLLGDYAEIENWIVSGQVDCGFLRLPTINPELETIFLEADPLMAVIPEHHPLADCKKFPVQELVSAPFLLLSRGANSDATDIFSNCGLNPRVHITTWDIFENLGYSIEWDANTKTATLNKDNKSISIQTGADSFSVNGVGKELDVPAYRRVGLALRSKKTASLAVKRFLEYLQYR